MTKLSDLQLVLLSTAAQRADGNLLPLPEGLGTRAGGVSRTIAAIIKRGYASEAAVAQAAHSWREDGEARFGAFITDAGRDALGLEPAQPPETGSSTAVEGPQKAPTKIQLVLDLLKRGDGATLDDLVAATGWLPHTTRAALTGLRKKGHVIERGKRQDVTVYSIAAAA